MLLTTSKKKSQALGINQLAKNLKSVWREGTESVVSGDNDIVVIYFLVI